MAIKVGGFVAPRAEPQKREKREMSDAEKILQGLQIIQSGFNIYTNYEKIGQIQSQKKLTEARTAELRKPEAPKLETRERVITDPSGRQSVITEQRDERGVYLPIEGTQRDVGMSEKVIAAQQARTEAIRKEGVKEAQRIASEERKEKRTIDKETRKKEETFLKSAQDNLEIGTAFKGIEQAIGFNLDTYDPSTNTAEIRGQRVTVDIPGFNVPVTGQRVSRLTEGARAVDRNVATLLNTKLKDRSGAAVTPSELARLEKEFAGGAFASEEDFLAALKGYKEAVTSKLRLEEKSVSPEFLRSVEEAGGLTSFIFSGQQAPVFGPPGSAQAAPQQRQPSPAEQLRALEEEEARLRQKLGR